MGLPTRWIRERRAYLELGFVTTATGFGSSQLGYQAVVQPDGKIVVVGQTDAGGPGWNVAVVRYNSDGSLDTSFDGDGRVATDIGSSTDQGYSLTVQPDGKILVAGDTR